jgi:hypothetical protein
MTGDNVIRRLLENIDANYQFEQQMWKGYYKEKLTDSAGPLYLAEGVLDIYFPGNSLKYDWQMSVVKCRKSTFKRNETIEGIKISGNAHDMVQTLISGNDSFLNESRVGNFNFSYDGYTVLNGKQILIVNFVPNSKKEAISGTLYVEENSFALVKASYEIDTRRSKVWEEVDWEEEFVEKDGKWYFHRMGYRGVLNLDLVTFNLESVLVINESKVVPFQPAMGLLMEPRDYFFDEVKHFDEDFWRGFDIIKLNKAELQAVK